MRGDPVKTYDVQFLRANWIDPNPDVISRSFVMASDSNDATNQARMIKAPEGAIACRVLDLTDRPVALFVLVVD
jgi:hypothetical protein